MLHVTKACISFHFKGDLPHSGSFISWKHSFICPESPLSALSECCKGFHPLPAPLLWKQEISSAKCKWAQTLTGKVSKHRMLQRLRTHALHNWRLGAWKITGSHTDLFKVPFQKHTCVENVLGCTLGSGEAFPSFPWWFQKPGGFYQSRQARELSVWSPPLWFTYPNRSDIMLTTCKTVWAAAVLRRVNRAGSKGVRQPQKQDNKCDTLRLSLANIWAYQITEEVV